MLDFPKVIKFKHSLNMFISFEERRVQSIFFCKTCVLQPLEGDHKGRNATIHKLH